MTISASGRRSIVATAVSIVDAYIPYVALDSINYYSGGTSVGYIREIRCDGVVEYAYEANGYIVWWPAANSSHWSILSYPGDHNDAPTPPTDPSYEFSPWAQRGAPGGSLFGQPGNTYMTRGSVINLPTYQVTQVSGNGYVDVTVTATDESGIHYIGYRRPGESTWSYSPTQPQHPTSDSYSYTVRVTASGIFYTFAEDNGGNFPATVNGYTITVTVNSPSAPTANSASSVTSSGFTANWSSVGSATGYRLDISTSSSFNSYVSGFQDLDVGNVTSKAVNSLGANTTYYYRVRAYNSGGTSGNSGTITVTTLPNPPPAPTASAASGVSNGDFTANWSSASGATSYRLDVSISSGFGSYVGGYQDLNVGNVTNQNVGGLNAGTTYYYRVRAVNSGGTSGNSGTIGVTTTPAPPAINAASSVTSSNFIANWSSSAGASGYRLDVATNSAFTGYVSGYHDLDVGNVVSQNVSSLAANASYYCRVRAYNTNGTSGNSATNVVTTLPPVIIATRQQVDLVLSWPTNDPAFKLFYSSNLSSSVWISNSIAPAIVGGQYTITNGMTNGARFYRLKK